MKYIPFPVQPYMSCKRSAIHISVGPYFGGPQLEGWASCTSKNWQPVCPRQAESHAKLAGHKMRQTRRQRLFLGEKGSTTKGSGIGKEGKTWNFTFLNGALQRSKRADAGKNSSPSLAFLLVFLGSHLQAPEWVGFQVESVALCLWELDKAFH